MALAAGILTGSGGRASHAAVVARQLGNVCLVAYPELGITGTKPRSHSHIILRRPAECLIHRTQVNLATHQFFDFHEFLFPALSLNWNWCGCFGPRAIDTF
jgi:hypothetical protein